MSVRCSTRTTGTHFRSAMLPVPRRHRLHSSAPRPVGWRITLRSCGAGPMRDAPYECGPSPRIGNSKPPKRWGFNRRPWMTHSGLYIVCRPHCRSPSSHSRLGPRQVAELNHGTTTNHTGLHTTMSVGGLVHLLYNGYTQRQRADFHVLPELVEHIATVFGVTNPHRVQG